MAEMTMLPRYGITATPPLRFMTIRRYLLLAVTALGLSACNAPHKLGSSSSSPSSPARYNYNAATQSYEWQQGDRQVTGSYQP